MNSFGKISLNTSYKINSGARAHYDIRRIISGCLNPGKNEKEGKSCSVLSHLWAIPRIPVQILRQWKAVALANGKAGVGIWNLPHIWGEKREKKLTKVGSCLFFPVGSTSDRVWFQGITHPWHPLSLNRKYSGNLKYSEVLWGLLRAITFRC